MPNNSRIPFCPYYKDEKNKSISCEDTYHSFLNADEKYEWMDVYCVTWDWQKCPYAIELTQAYENLEKGDKKALEKQKIEAMQKELKSLSSKLGRAEKRIERQQKKIDRMRVVNKSFVRTNESLERQKQEFYKRWREAQAELDKGNDLIMEELNKLGLIYEQRMCYLMDKFSEGFFCEGDVITWAEDKEFALVREYDEDLGDMVWKVVFKEDGEDNNVQDAQEQGEQDEVRQS